MKATCKVVLSRLQPSAILPTQQCQGDAGFDLYAVENTRLLPNVVTAVATGLRIIDIQKPANKHVVLKIEGRSGLASKGIFPVGGVVDESFRGHIKVLLAYLTTDTAGPPWGVIVNAGDRIAQLVVYPVYTDTGLLYSFEEDTQTGTDTSRGACGFGSTGT